LNWTVDPANAIFLNTVPVILVLFIDAPGELPPAPVGVVAFLGAVTPVEHDLQNA
jgi:hypothetical protein